MRHAALGAAAAVWLALAGGAWAWSPPTVLSRPGEPSTLPAVAIAGNGRAVVVWHDFVDSYHLEVWARVREPGADAWQPPQLVSDGVSGLEDEPAVAMDDRGDALVVWNGDSRAIRSAYAPAGQPFEPTKLVAVDANGFQGGRFPFVAFDAVGEALATWREEDLRIHYAIRGPSGDFSAAQAVPLGASLGIEWTTSVALAPNGAAAIAWTDTKRVWLSRRPPGGVFGTPQPVSDASVLTQAPHIAIDPDGNVTVVWWELEKEGDFYGTMRAQVIAPNGSAIVPATVLAKTMTGGAVVSLSPTGDTTIVWPGQSVVPEYYAGVMAVTRPAGQPFGAAEVIAPADLGTDDLPALAYDSEGTTRVVWRHYDDRDATHVRVRMLLQDRPPGGRFRAEPLAIGSTEDITTPAVLAVGPSGMALSAWTYGAFAIGPLQVVEEMPSSSLSWSSPAGAQAGGQAGPAAASGDTAALVSSRRPARCHVPRLAGLTRTAAQRRLRRAHCSLGATRRVHGRHRRGRVVRQRPAAGKWLARHGRVAIVLAA